MYQHLEYTAWGETLVEEHSNTDRTPYLFNGKELDEETGLYYYGARYYDARVSVWQSVDPKSETYPSLSPYAYAANNPMTLIDPNGMEIVGDTEGVEKLKSKANSIIASENKRQARLEQRIESRAAKGKSTEKLEGKLSSSRAREAELNSMLSEITTLENSETVYNVNMNYAEQADGTSGNTSYDASNDRIQIDVSKSYGLAGLAHELKHAYQFEKGAIDFFDNGSPGLLYDVSDEISAFRRQFAISPSSLGGRAKNFSSINDAFVRSLNSVYTTLPAFSLDKNSSLLRIELNWNMQGQKIKLTNGVGTFNIRYHEANYGNLKFK